MKIDLDYAAASPLTVETGSCQLVADCQGPRGLSPAAVKTALAETLSSPLSGPPLAQHVVPGDRVVIALPERLPGGTAMLELIVQGLCSSLEAGGVAAEDISLLLAPPLELLGPDRQRNEPAFPDALAAQVVSFDPSLTEQTAYLLADADGEPLHLARQLVDADVVVAVECLDVDAALGGRSPAGELWPGFGRQDRRFALARGLLHNRLQVLTAWRDQAAEVTGQLGLLASLRLVAGRDDSLAGLGFGFPADSLRQARQLAQGWRPAPPKRAALTLAGIAAADCSLASLTRAVAAAARTTQPDGTICVACSLATLPDGLFSSWRRGESLRSSVADAVESDDPTILAEALQTQIFARALGDRRLVLLSGLDEETVESLDIGYADSPDAINRLIRQTESVVVLHEADRFCPRR